MITVIIFILSSLLFFQKKEDQEVGEYEEMANMYHKVVHSCDGAALLMLEHQYSREVALLVRRRDAAIDEHDKK